MEPDNSESVVAASRLSGLYATDVYLPVSRLSKWLKKFSRAVRGKPALLYDTSTAPKVHWIDCIPRSAIRLAETEKRNRNQRISELALLAHAAAAANPGSTLFEIGTYDGRTTLNIALNAPSDCRVVTLDLPPDDPKSGALKDGSVETYQHLIGSRYRAYLESFPGTTVPIEQLYGDSTEIDYRPWRGKCGLVFVDGDHSYEGAKADSQSALDLVAPGGMILWHDYGIWEGVNRALDELNRERQLNLKHLRGTTLVFYRCQPRG